MQPIALLIVADPACPAHCYANSAVKAENLHRTLNAQASRLADILCHREQRHVSQQLSLAYDRRQIILERSEVADGLAGQYVEVYDFADRPLEVRWKGHSLPYSAKTSASATPPSSRTSAYDMR